MKLSPDDAAASSDPLHRDQGPAAPSFPGTPGRRRPEDSPMPQQTRDGHEPAPAGLGGRDPAPDETARLDGGPAAAPPPLTGGHAQSAGQGRTPAAAPVPSPEPAGEVYDTRPVSRDWRATSAPEAAAPPAADGARADL